MTNRLRTVKTILWGIMGVLAVVSVARFTRGLGAVTNLSDATPWGIWIAFDVMAGVALAAGGFTLAATVYIFRLERYRPFVRPAILTAFLGYVAVAVGLIYDLGLPWHIWHPVVYPQPHSVLFEVAMCVILYLTVLALEFSPVVLEHQWFDRVPVFRAMHRVLKRATIPLVIAGIMLSTLHQSSLGSLFLITPSRLHPLWYSPVIWVLFLVSAIGVGLLMVTLESYVSAWLFGHELPRKRLAGLGRAASVTLLVYAVVRLADLAWRGRLGLAMEPSSAAGLFWLEMALSAIIPGILLALPVVRRSVHGLGLTALVGVLGIIGYRFDVAIVAFSRPGGASYFPSWMEVAVSVGIVAGALLVFIFFVEHLRVYETPHQPAEPTERLSPFRSRSVLPPSLAFSRHTTLAFIAGVAIALALLPGDARTGMRLRPVPAFASRAVEGTITPRVPGPGHDLMVAVEPVARTLEASPAWLRIIDGNRDGRQVLFPHDLHETALGDDTSCTTCHHANLPFSQQSDCASCHRDMYSPTDIFDHTSHVTQLNADASCVRCHEDDTVAKTRANATPCTSCHVTMYVDDSRVQLEPEQLVDGHAAGYLDAMHGLCIDCHEERMETEPAKHQPDFAECRNCHRDEDEETIRRLPPYVVPADDLSTAQARGLPPLSENAP
jgi:Ni/Fe-hydrogenase subunit HybB-like protein